MVRTTIEGNMGPGATIGGGAILNQVDITANMGTGLSVTGDLQRASLISRTRRMV